MGYRAYIVTKHIEEVSKDDFGRFNWKSTELYKWLTRNGVKVFRHGWLDRPDDDFYPEDWSIVRETLDNITEASYVDIHEFDEDESFYRGMLRGFIKDLKESNPDPESDYMVYVSWS